MTSLKTLTKMLAKPFLFLLSFSFSLVNFLLLMVPLTFAVFPLFMFFSSLFDKVGVQLFFFLVSRISFVMILYIFADAFFGITVRRFTKKAIPIEKAEFLFGRDDIEKNFNWLKRKFDLPDARLYIDKNFEDVNAYAIGSVRKKTVTITVGLIDRIKARSEGYENYIDAISGVMGHEMSHLANSDYLPGLITAANEVANRNVARVIRWLLLFVANSLRIIPIFGKYLFKIFVKLYNWTNFFVYFFYRWLFMPIYRFFQRWFGRSLEYRSDRESAYAYGGRRMALGLSALGKGSYFSVFYTHPRTESRIKHVKDIQPHGGTIEVGIFNRLSNILSIMLVLFVFAYSTHLSDMPDLYKHYLTEVHIPINNDFLIFKENVMKWYYSIKY